MVYLLGTVMIGVAGGFLLHSIPWAFVIIGTLFIVGSIFEVLSGKTL